MPRKAPILLTFIAPAAAALAPSFVTQAGEKQGNPDAAEVRAKVKAGELRPCVSETVTDADSQPVIAFQNDCTHQANVMLCVNVPGKEPVHYMLLIASRSKVLHRLWNTDGKPFTYNFNVCDRPYCTPPASEC